MKYLPLYIVIVSLSAILLVSCAPSATITIEPSGSGTVSFSTTMGTAAEKIVRGFIGAGDGVSLFERDKVVKSVAASGLSIQSLSFPSAGGIDVTLSVPDMNAVLPVEPALVTVITSKEKGTSECTLHLTAQTARAVMAVMPPDTADYVDLLMAPLFTGEELDSAEYISVMAAVYGKSLADELASSVLTLTIRPPAPPVYAAIEDSRQGMKSSASRSGAKAVFSIPLPELLSLRDSITCTVRW